jgi:membrane protein YqaA with SNARE-associated domain
MQRMRSATMSNAGICVGMRFAARDPAVRRAAGFYTAGQLALRFALSLAFLALATVSLSHWFKSELKLLSIWFYDDFGASGAAIGTWLADGFNFPVPPQAYMVLAELHGTVAETFPAIVAGSLVGGLTGYLFAPLLTRIAWIAALIERTQPKVKHVYDRRWILASLLLSLSPIAFSWLCYSAALYRVPRRVLGLLCLLRIPKLAIYQQLISWSWS